MNRRNRNVRLVSLLLLGLTRAGFSQEGPRAKPPFAVAISEERLEFEEGAPMLVKLTMTNLSDREFRYSVAMQRCPPPIEHLSATRRQVQVLISDSAGTPVPLTPRGAAVQGMTGPVVWPPRRPGEQGHGCGGGGVLAVPQRGDSRTEEADLSKEFAVMRPGKYAIYAQRLDEGSGTLVETAARTLTIRAAHPEADPARVR